MTTKELESKLGFRVSKETVPGTNGRPPYDKIHVTGKGFVWPGDKAHWEMWEALLNGS